ncbi:MAG: phosphoadenylylsulfate reductase [Opitutus sp.]|nr:phosphoadenylylsulfate reductase [Opitutus sp.]
MSQPPAANQLAQWNNELRTRTPPEVARWAIQHGAGRAIVSTNFRPYEAAILHLATQAQPDIRVLWVDHGYNRPATYRHAEQLRAKLRLNVHAFLPRVTVAHREALHGPVPDPADEPAMKAFSAQMKLEPFQRGMRELAPTVWLTALRRDQTPDRAGLDLVTWDGNFRTLKVSPFLEWNDAQLDVYLREHGLPNEHDYYDPAKGDAKRECGLHAAWGRRALAGVGAEAAAR